MFTQTNFDVTFPFSDKYNCNGNNSHTIEFHTVLSFVLYTIVNFTTQSGENRHTDLAKFATLIHTKKLIHCVAIFTILYGKTYPPHGELKLKCIGKFARRPWINFTQQYGKNRERYQRNTFYYDVWQLLLYFYREFPSKILSAYNWTISDFLQS